tara:strand:- start:250 stop:480 length:231 start_codon:yes stop_codon:yes gene_type:complete
MKKVITTTLLVILAVAVVLLSKDLKEQEALIDDLKKKQDFHDIRLSGQLELLLSHEAQIKSVAEYLLKGRSFVSAE